MDVAAWLRGLGLEQYEPAFRDNYVDADVLPDLTAEDLINLGVTAIGHRRKLLSAIAELRAEAPAAAVTAAPGNLPAQVATPAPPSVPAPAPAAAERRQLTVMFCDLVGSTALSTRHDPEDLRDLISGYHRAVAKTVGRFDGFVAKYMGDGVLIYFGYPHAHEDDAERAVRSGLAVIEAVGKLPTREDLRVRLGVATGLAVVGDLIGEGAAQERGVIGETPNLAARLQALAGPNMVVIAEATRRQIGGLFDLEDFGPQQLAGFSEPQRAWRVLGESGEVSRFEALRSGETPLVGRDEEVELLLRCWEQVKTGEGRVVLLSGEPGIGKSRLTAALSEQIGSEPHTRLRYFCSPHHQDSTLYPFIAQLERAAGFARDDGPETKLDKLATLLGAAVEIGDLSLLVELLSLPGGDRFAPLELSPQRKKQRTFATLLRQLEGLALTQPTLMIFEDLHWIDPTSREFLDLVLARIDRLPVLLIATFRPEFQPPWTGQPHVTVMSLNRLRRDEGAAMVERLAGNAALLPPDVIAEIVERTDGVPLFVEEMTKAVLETGAERGWGVAASVPRAGLGVPATLQALLMARLDRLGASAKEVAQTGAAIDREFQFVLLELVVELPGPHLRESLDRLTNAGLVFARGTPPHSSYIFKHALVQDAAYGTLLRSRRQRLHGRIAASLEDRFPEIVLNQPALLARHCEAAGLPVKAVAWWLKAGQKALASSAMGEAVIQLRKGLDVLARLPDEPWRRQHELDLLVALGSALPAAKGYSAADARETVARARALAEQLDRPEYLVLLLVGQRTVHVARSEHRPALALGEQLEQLGVRRNDARARLLGLYSQGVSRLWLGEFVAARTLLDGCMGLADPAHRSVGERSYDPYVVLLTWLALDLACLGYMDQARSRIDEALSEARRLGHTHTLAHALCMAAWLDWLTGAHPVHVEEFLALTTEQGFPFYVGWAMAFRGRSLVALGQAKEGLELMTRALEELHAIGSIVSTSQLYAWLAEVNALLGQSFEVQRCLAEAVRLVETTEERFGEAEYSHRVPGDLLNAAGERSAAERHYRQAMAVAEQQGARLFQLRASIRLARLWQEQGKRVEAHELLAPIYGWFTEGFDLPDLKDAKLLLDALA